MIPATKCAVEVAFPGVITFTVEMARTVGNGDVGVVGRVSGRALGLGGLGATVSGRGRERGKGLVSCRCSSFTTSEARFISAVESARAVKSRKVARESVRVRTLLGILRSWYQF